MKAKWLLSYQDHPRIVKLYRARGIHFERLKVTYALGGKCGRSKPVRELLIRNF